MNIIIFIFLTVKPTGCGFDLHSRRWNIYIKRIFPFLRSGVEAKRDVESCHLTRNTSRIRQKVGNGLSYTRFPLLTLLCAGYSVKLIINIFISLFWHQVKSLEWNSFYHSTRNALKKSAKSGALSVLTLGSLCLLWYLRDTTWRRFYTYLFSNYRKMFFVL